MKKAINATFSTIKIYYTAFLFTPFNVASHILEKLELIPTDFIPQWLRQEYFKFRFNKIPEDQTNGSQRHPVCKSLIRAEEAVTFGRPISDKGKNTYTFLSNRGISKRDMRIAVFSNFINDDGSISFKPFKLRIGQALAWWMLTISTVALIDFALWLMHNPADWLTSVTAFGVFTTVLVILEYPLIVLGLRTVQVAARIKQASPPYLLS